MASTKELRRRIRSVKNTAQITKAMQMVSATKMRRAQNQTLSSRPYILSLSHVLSLVFSERERFIHPLLSPGSVEKVGVLVLTSDKGLCGSLNTNVIRALSAERFKLKDNIFYSLGKKGRDFLLRSGRNLGADFENKDKISFADASRIRKTLISEFNNQAVGEVYLIYPHFISTLTQKIKVIKLLPVDEEVLKQWLLSQGENRSGVEEDNLFVYEPTKSVILDYTLVHFIDTQIYQAMVETKASEHSARMMAMQTATDNAKALVDDLTLTYNGLRQENITRELLEITSAEAALE